MSRRRTVIRRSVLALAALLVLALVGGTVAVTAIVRRPFPQAGGELVLPGLEAEARVLRDELGVPQIYATTPEDLFRAQGYVNAQDRFFEMDYRRHVTAGRLAELVGDNPTAIEADRVVRTFGWRRVAEQEWDLLEPETRSYLQAYADGVNAYLEDRSTTQLAMEYTVLGVQVDVEAPEPWDPIDSVAWLKAMAWDLRGNYDEELERAVAYGVTPDVGLVEQIFPRYEAEENLPILDSEEWLEHRTAAAAAADVDEAETAAATVHLGATEGQGTGDPAPALDDDGLQDALASAAKALDAVPHTVAEGEGTGSNSWVVSGEHTESGLPLLANDPHLGLAAPSIWSQVGLHCEQVGQACPFDVSGFSFAGFPGVIIGHNGDLAWGLTNLGADVTDFFVEAVRGDEYRYDGVLEPLEVRTETIEVNGADPVTIQVRSTRNGPIISGELSETVGALRTPLGDDGRGGEFAVSLGWTALTPGRSADAIFELNLAKDAADVASAAALFEVPSQNIVFATADGHIGYQAPGRVPVRARVDGDVPSDGSWPRPGWSSDYAWQGYVDSADMPAILDPAEGFIVAANQAVVDEGGGPFLTRDWDYGYRSQRIRSLITGQIESGSPITVESMAAMQSDDWSPFAAHLVPVLLEQQLDDDFAADGQALLEDWDYTTGTDSSAAAYLNAVWANLLQDTFWDDLPQTAWPDGGSRWLSVVSTLLDDPTSPWWDDRTTVNVVETRDEILISALVDARAELTTSLGKDAADWRWGRLHLLSLEHIVLGGPDVPSVVRHFVNPDPVEMPGGSSIVNATSWDAAALDGERRSFAVTSGPSMRMVVDLADPDASRWVVVTGVSGHPGHPHYADQTAAWSVGESFAWLFSDAAVARGAKDTLVLRPGTGS